MLTNLWEDLSEWMIAAVVGCFDKISGLSIYAFSPQLLVFHKYFNGSELKIYTIFFEVSFVIALVLFTLKIIAGIINPNDKKYESPFLLIKGFIRYMIILQMVPLLISWTLSMANTVYWTAAAAIDPGIVSSEGMWSGLQNMLIGVIEKEDTVDPASQGLTEEERNLLIGSESWLSGLGESLETDSYESTVEMFEENWQADRYSEGFMAKLISFFLILWLFKEYFCFLIEMAERYVMVGVLTLCAPLAMSPLVSEDTKGITKKYIQMWISQLIVLILSVVFLTTFQYAMKNAYRFIYGYYEFGTGINITVGSTGKIVQVGGTYLFVVVMIAYLKAGQRVDSYLNTLGLSAAQTGGLMSQMAGQMMSKMVGLATRAVGTVAGGVFNPKGNGNSNSNRTTSGDPTGSIFGRFRANADPLASNIESSNQKARDLAREQFGVGKNGPGVGTNNEKKYADSINGLDDKIKQRMDANGWKGLQEDLGSTGTGMEGALAAEYAHNMFQSGDAKNNGDFLIPNDAKIDKAKFEEDGSGFIDYRDSEGNSHHLVLNDFGEEHPTDGPNYGYMTDAAGDAHSFQDSVNQSMGDEMNDAKPRDFDDSVGAVLPGYTEEDTENLKNMIGAEPGDNITFAKDANGTYTATDEAGNDIATNIKAENTATYNGSGEKEDSVRYDTADGRTISANVPDIVEKTDKDGNRIPVSNTRPMQNIDGSFSRDPETGKYRKGTEFSLDKDIEGKESLAGVTGNDVRAMVNENKAAGNIVMKDGDGSLKRDSDGTFSAYDRYGNRVAEKIHTASKEDFEAARAKDSNVIGQKIGDGRYLMAERSGDNRMQNQHSFNENYAAVAGSAKLKGATADDVRTMLNENHSAGKGGLKSGDGAFRQDKNDTYSAYDSYGNKVATNIHTASEADYKKAKESNGESVIGKKLENGSYVMGERVENRTEPKKAEYGLRFDQDHYKETGKKRYEYKHIDKDGSLKTEYKNPAEAEQILRQYHDTVGKSAHIDDCYKPASMDRQAYAQAVSNSIAQGRFPTGARFETSVRAMFGKELEGYKIDVSDAHNGFRVDEKGRNSEITVIARKLDAEGRPSGTVERITFTRNQNAAPEKVVSESGETWGKRVTQRAQNNENQQRHAQARKTVPPQGNDNRRNNRTERKNGISGAIERLNNRRENRQYRQKHGDTSWNGENNKK